MQLKAGEKADGTTTVLVSECAECDEPVPRVGGAGDRATIDRVALACLCVIE